MDVDAMREQTPGLFMDMTGSGRIHLNAARSLQSQATIDAAKRHLDLEAMMHTSDEHEAEAVAMVNTAHRETARVIGCNPSEGNGARAVQSVIRTMGLRKTDKVVCHGLSVNPARVRCSVEYAPTDARGRLDYDGLEHVFDDSVRLLVVPMLELETGEELRFDSLVRMAHVHGCRVLVDTTCCVGYRSIDATALAVDFLLASGHGYLRGPPGVTACICHSENDALVLRSDAAFCGIDEAYTAASDGFSTLACVVAFGSACAELGALGLPSVQHQIRVLTAELRHKLESVPYIEVLSCADGTDADSVVRFQTRQGYNIADLEARISDSGVVVETTASAVHVRAHYYNTAEEIRAAVDRMSAALAAMAGAHACPESDADGTDTEWIHLTLSTTASVDDDGGASDGSSAEEVMRDIDECLASADNGVGTDDVLPHQLACEDPPTDGGELTSAMMAVPSPETPETIDDGGCPLSHVTVTGDVAIDMAHLSAGGFVSPAGDAASASRPDSADSMYESVASYCEGTRVLEGVPSPQPEDVHESISALDYHHSTPILDADPTTEYYPSSDDEHEPPVSPFHQSWSELEMSDEDRNGEEAVDESGDDSDSDDDDASIAELVNGAFASFEFDNPLFGASDDEHMERTCASVESIDSSSSSNESAEHIGSSDLASESGEESISGFSSDSLDNLSDDDADSLRASPANFATSSAVSRPIAICRSNTRGRHSCRPGTPQSDSSSLGLHEVLGDCQLPSRTPPEFVVGSPPRSRLPRAFTPAASAPKLTWEDIRSSTPPPIRNSSSFTAAWASGRTTGFAAHHALDTHVLPPQICRSL